MVDCGSAQGRIVMATTGVAALRRGLPKRENAGLGCKRPFMDARVLAKTILIFGFIYGQPSHTGQWSSRIGHHQYHQQLIMTGGIFH